MKELYLIPKHQYDVMKTKTNHHHDDQPQTTNDPSHTPGVRQNNIPKVRKSHTPKLRKSIPQVGQQWRTKVLPPPLRKPIEMKSISYGRSQIKVNPNIHHLLSMKFFGKNLAHARILLDHFEKNGIIEWNEYGDILHPIKGYNIVDFMFDIISSKKMIDSKKFNDYKFLINSVNIPMTYIQNSHIRHHLTHNPPTRITAGHSRLSRPSKSSTLWKTF